MRCPQLSCAVQEARGVTDRSVAVGTSLESLGDLLSGIAWFGALLGRSVGTAKAQGHHGCSRRRVLQTLFLMTCMPLLAVVQQRVGSARQRWDRTDS